MTAIEIIALLNNAAQMTSTLAELVQRVRGTLNEDDRAKINAALVEIQLRNEADYAAARGALLAAGNQL